MIHLNLAHTRPGFGFFHCGCIVTLLPGQEAEFDWFLCIEPSHYHWAFEGLRKRYAASLTESQLRVGVSKSESESQSTVVPRSESRSGSPRLPRYNYPSRFRSRP